MTPEDFTTFRLKPGRKDPAVRAWQKTPKGRQTSSPHHGVVTGGGLVVIDLDVKEDVDGIAAWEDLESAHGEVCTYTVETPSGGLHFYFSTDETFSNSAGKLAPGIDVRGDGGFVVGAGSETDAGTYVLVDEDEPIAPLPGWVATLLKRKAPPAAAPVNRTISPIDSDDIREAIKGARSEFAAFWKKVVDGLYPFPKAPGGWNDYLTRATRWLAGRDAMAHASGAHVAEIMGGSLGHMRTRCERDGEKLTITANDIASMFDRAALKEAEERASTQSVLDAWDKAKEETAEEGHEGARLLLYRRGYYLAHERLGFIGPYLKEEVIPQARFRETFPTERPRPNGDGLREASINECMKDFGAGVDEVIRHLGLPKGYLEKSPTDGYILHVPASVPPVIEARYNENIHKWLRALGGDKLLDWIAVSKDLAQAAPALWISGGAGIGKDILAYGLAGLWGPRKPPTPLDVALGRFDAVLAECPLIFANEGLPRDNRGMTDVEALKRIVSTTRRLTEPKGLPHVTLMGAVRVLIVTNNMDSIKASKDLTSDDARALCERLIHIRREGEAAKIIATYLHEQPIQTEWLDGGGLAMHMQWIVENREPEQGRRFRIDGAAGDLQGMLLTGAGSASFWVMKALSQWVVSGGSLGGLAYEDGRVWATASGVESLLDDAARSTLAQLGQTLRRISEGTKKRLTQGNGRAMMWGIPIERLTEWAKADGYLDPEDIMDGARRREKREA